MMLPNQLTNSFLWIQSNGKSIKLQKYKKNIAENETVGGIYFFFISETKHVDVWMFVAKWISEMNTLRVWLL